LPTAVFEDLDPAWQGAGAGLLLEVGKEFGSEGMGSG
jgi:hypothetical protein